MQSNNNNDNSESRIIDIESSTRSGFYGKHYRKILFAFLVLALPSLWISARVLTPGDMSAYILDVSHWLPEKSQWINDMGKFSEVAGKERSNVIRISWPGCRKDDSRLIPFTIELIKLCWGHRFPDSETDSIFNEVITIDDVAKKMKTSDASLSSDQIHRQLANVLIGPTGTTCVIATLATRDPVRRQHAIEQIYDVAQRIDGLGEGQIRLFGGPVYTKQVDDSGLRLASIFTPLSALVSLLCAWFCLRNFWTILAVFLNAVVCTCAALVSLYLTDAVMDPLLMLLPGFWFIIAMSAGIHLVNYYFDIVAEHSQDDGSDLATQAAMVAFKPAFLATLTTCIGMGALCTSEILPVWRFGFQASIGLICGFVTLFTFLPAWLILTSRALSKESIAMARERNSFWPRYGQLASKLGLGTAVVFLLLMGIAAIGFSRVEFSNKLSDQYAKNSRVNQDAAWFEQEIGPLLPFEVLVRFSKDNLPRPSECLAFVAELQGGIEATQIPCKTLSATAVVPFESGTGARQSIIRTVLDKRLNRHHEALLETGFVTDEDESQLWRISVFAYNSIDVSMNDYFSAIQSAVKQQQLNADATGLAVEMSYAGLGSRMAVITQKLEDGLMQSCLTSAVLIALVVIVALRSFALGITAMLPNIFPVVIAFGAFGYFQPRLDVGSIMTASIAMGIAVDDTIHFMYWFRQGISGGRLRADAVTLAIRKSGRAIASTSLICGFGFLVFFFGDFMPAVRFGQLLFIMLAAALIGDLVFLPALLLGMPARLFGLSTATKLETALTHSSTAAATNWRPV